MPIAIILLLIDVSLIVHAAKTGRFSPWAYLILLLPGVGAVAYVPGRVAARVVWQRAGAEDPPACHQHARSGEAVPQVADDLSITDTIANRVDLAEECLLLGKFEEALAHYENALSRPLGDEPAYALGKARAQFGLKRPQDAVVTLDQLR